MSGDGWNDRDERASARRRFPRWMYLVFLFDAILIAGVLYWVYGCDRSPATPRARLAPGEVQGAPIDSPPVASVGRATKDRGEDAVEELDKDGFSEWDGSDDFEIEDSEVRDLPSNSMAPGALTGSGLDAAMAIYLGTPDQVLPRPTITREENQTFAPASFADIGNWRYERSWGAIGASADGPANRIPTRVLDWNGKKIAILGFMQPLHLDEQKRVTNFMLMKNQASCCYGVPITLADWIDIKARPGEAFDSMLHRPITVLGTLEVGEEKVDGFTVSVFRMTPEKVLPPGEKP